MASTVEPDDDPVLHFSDLLSSLFASSIAPLEDRPTGAVDHSVLPATFSQQTVIRSERQAQRLETVTPYTNPELEEEIATYASHSGMNLTMRRVTDEDMELLVEHAIRKKQCTGLELWGNEITSQGVAILADAMHNNTTLQELRLSDNRVTASGVDRLAQVLSINTCNLRGLELDSNSIMNEGAQYLSEMLTVNCTLAYLTLSQTRIGDRGVQLLAKALAEHNTSLKKLDLSMNPLVTDASIDPIVDMLQHNRSLKKLDIYECQLSTRGNRLLKDAVKDRTNFTLGLTESYFPIPDVISLWTSFRSFLSS